MLVADRIRRADRSGNALTGEDALAGQLATHRHWTCRRRTCQTGPVRPSGFKAPSQRIINERIINERIINQYSVSEYQLDITFILALYQLSSPDYPLITPWQT